MQVSPLQRDVRAAELPLERLAASKEISQEAKVAEVSRQFEAVLLRQIISQAQKPMFKSSLFPSGGATNDIYQDMVTQQLADRISQGGTFGFAKVLEKQLTVESGGKSADRKIDAANSDKADPAPLGQEKVQEKIRKYKSPAIQPGKRI
jgi:Rod binding domain-containing protein